MRVVASLVLLTAVVLAGCAQPPASTTTAATTLSPAMAALLAQLKVDPVPALDGASVAKWLQAFVDAHHPRLTGTPGEKEAGDDLAAQFAKLGYAVERRKYGANGLPSADGPIQVIVAVKKGTTMPDHLIISGAHYDTAPIGTGDITPGTLPITPPVGTPPLYATYDNGSGTAMVMELARLLAHANNTHTIEFVLFNGEEEGVLASGVLAKELAAKGAKVDAYIGFDMVGINYPSPAGCLCIYAGKRAAA
ncbi:MAG: M28 family peptidase, partial [Candidatus Thermoplasmatota archaeon]